MAKASKFFEVFESAKYITRDADGSVAVWQTKPVTDTNNGMWFNLDDHDYIYEPVEEFADADWQDCIIERPKEVETVEDLREWLAGHGREEDRGIYKFVAENSNILTIDTNGGGVEIYTDDVSFVFGGTPAQIKRVLEAML